MQRANQPKLYKDIASSSSGDNSKNRTRIIPQKPPRPAPIDSTKLLFIGLSLIIGSIFLLVFGLYAVLFSSYMPDTNVWILDIIKYDEHYKYLVLLCIPSGLVAVIVNWGGLHYFRHA